ncbi:MAG: glycine betaine ABC transporter substrate-binding protein, partial [Culicoidibacterales bacterium]
LGFLIFSGIRSLNTQQILAGAIPAVLLALAVDFILGRFEFAITPLGLKISDGVDKQKLKWQIRWTKIGLIVLVALGGSAYLLRFCQAPDSTEQIIVVGSKDFTEQLILGNLVAELIEAKTDIRVQRKLNLGGTQVVFDALKRGDIDLYIEYTGTIYGDMLKHPPISDVEAVYATSKQELEAAYPVTVLAQMQFNNTFTLAVTPTLAAEYDLATISDLKGVSENFVTGTSFEFLNREDGLVGIKVVYGLTFKDSRGLDSSARYLALENGDVQIIDAFSTDGLLKKFDLVVLEDDLGVFPPYYAVPLIGNEVLATYPELELILATLAQQLTNATMIELNYLVDVQQLEASAVAHQFLIETGLITE